MLNTYNFLNNSAALPNKYNKILYLIFLEITRKISIFYTCSFLTLSAACAQCFMLAIWNNCGYY